MSTQTTKEVIRKGIASALYREILDPQRSYFVVLGRSYPWNSRNGVILSPGGETIPFPIDSVEDYNNSLRDGFFAKRIGANDIRLMVPLIQWAKGTRYAKYASNTNIFDERYLYYVCTSDGSVYKCLENGRNIEETGLPSLIEPSSKDTENAFSTPDGYTWKYLYTVPEYEKRLITQFSDETNYIPVSKAKANYAYGERVLQYEVQENAIPGTIDSVFINPTTGLSGNANIPNSAYSVSVSTAKSQDYRVISGVSGATTMVIGSPTLISQSNNIYREYTITITNGAAAGIFREITGYTYAASGGLISFREPLPKDVPVGSNYQIAPTIKILGDGTGGNGYLKLTEFPKSFDVEKFVVTDRGRDYTYALTTKPAPLGSLINFSSHPNIAPFGGHGYDAVNELNPTYIQLCVDIDGGETASTLQLADGSFRQISIVKDPLLWNTGKIAGTENGKYDEVVLRVLTGTADISSIVSGNYIFGETTRSVGKIQNIRNSGRDWILLVNGLNGSLVESSFGVNGENISIYSHSSPGSEFKRLAKDVGIVVSSSPFIGGNAINQAYKLTTTIGLTATNFSQPLSSYKNGFAYIMGVSADKFNSRIFSIRRVSYAGASASHYIELTGVVGIDNIITRGASASLSFDVLTAGGTIEPNKGTAQVVFVDPPAFEPLSGEMIYIENTENKTRSRVQMERVSILIKI